MPLAHLLPPLVLIVVGLVHVVPAVGVLGTHRLRALYGGVLRESDEVTLLLLRHRAVLFGIIGALSIAGAFVPGLQATALAVGLVSTLSFVALARRPVANANGKIRRIVRIDIACAAGLAVACVVAVLVR